MDVTVSPTERVTSGSHSLRAASIRIKVGIRRCVDSRSVHSWMVLQNPMARKTLQN